MSNRPIVDHLADSKADIVGQTIRLKFLQPDKTPVEIDIHARIAALLISVVGSHYGEILKAVTNTLHPIRYAIPVTTLFTETLDDGSVRLVLDIGEGIEVPFQIAAKDLAMAADAFAVAHKALSAPHRSGSKST